jgi:hypothetical protein
MHDYANAIYKCKSAIKINANLIICGGYDKDETHSFLFMLSILDGLKMIHFCSYNYANLVINTSCMLLYLSKVLYLFECKNLVYKIKFWIN